MPSIRLFILYFIHTKMSLWVYSDFESKTLDESEILTLAWCLCIIDGIIEKNGLLIDLRMWKSWFRSADITVFYLLFIFFFKQILSVKFLATYRFNVSLSVIMTCIWVIPIWCMKSCMTINDNARLFVI